VNGWGRSRKGGPEDPQKMILEPESWPLQRQSLQSLEVRLAPRTPVRLSLS
jgi:hypothetical protein